MIRFASTESLSIMKDIAQLILATAMGILVEFAV